MFLKTYHVSNSTSGQQDGNRGTKYVIKVCIKIRDDGSFPYQEIPYSVCQSGS